MTTHQEILTKAIEQAIASGWHNYGHPARAFAIGKDPLRIEYSDGSSLHLYGLLYDKEFAKALWGDIIKKIVIDDYDLSEKPQPLLGGLVEYPYNEGAKLTFKTILWQYHLQMMIVADDPIAYLGENLPA